MVWQIRYMNVSAEDQIDQNAEYTAYVSALFCCAKRKCVHTTIDNVNKITISEQCNKMNAVYNAVIRS